MIWAGWEGDREVPPRLRPGWPTLAGLLFGSARSSLGGPGKVSLTVSLGGSRRDRAGQLSRTSQTRFKRPWKQRKVKS